MPRYRVTYERHCPIQEATIEVEADSEADAEHMALQEIQEDDWQPEADEGIFMCQSVEALDDEAEAADVQ